MTAKFPSASIGVRIPADRRRDAGYWVTGLDVDGKQFSLFIVGKIAVARLVAQRIREGASPWEFGEVPDA